MPMKKARAWRALGGTLSRCVTLCRWLEPQDKLRLALGAVLDLVGGDDLQPLQLLAGGGQRLPELPHGAGVLHLALEPVQRVPLHRVGGRRQQSLQSLGHVLPAPDLHPLVPVDQAVFPVAEHHHPARVKGVGVRLALAVVVEILQDVEGLHLAHAVASRAVELAGLKEQDAFTQPLHALVKPVVLRAANAAQLDLPQ